MRTAPKCTVCKTRECSSDYEPESGLSYYSTCSPCFAITSSRPYCYNPDCSRRVCGTQTEIANRGPGITAETALYTCPNGCGTATRLGWTIGSARHSARHDAQAAIDGTDLAWLVKTRLSDKGIGRDYDAEHPIRRAYARAYVDTATAMLAEAGVLV